MPYSVESDSRKLLRRLRDALAAEGAGQERLDHVTQVIADCMETEVCSIYLLRGNATLELCATQGLRPDAVHVTRLRVGEGLVGRVAQRARPLNTADAPAQPGFRYMPETGEEVFNSFLGVPIQRIGETLGVLVVQSRDKREFSADEVYGLEVVAMVLAEMTELGAFVGTGETASTRHAHQEQFRGTIGQEGAAEGRVWLHEPRVVVTRPIADDTDAELDRLQNAVKELQVTIDDLLNDTDLADKDQRDVLEAYRMFASSRSWLKRMEEDVTRGLSAEAAVEKEQSAARSRMNQVPDPYLRERLQDLDDLSNRLLRILTGQGDDTGAEMPDDPVLVARNIGPGELLAYGRKLKGIVLEEGSPGSHAVIVARAWAIPLVLNARGVTTSALNGDPIMVDGDAGIVHLRPEENVARAFRDKVEMRSAAAQEYSSIRHLPARTLSGEVVEMHMNAGLMADLPSLIGSGAEGVGLFRTELQFLARPTVPKRGDLAALYARVLKAAGGRRVAFRTLDIGSDKVLPYMKPTDEPNPALGWRAIRVGLDKPGVMRMQLQALIRAAAGGPLTVMFPFVAQLSEFQEAREYLLAEIEREARIGHPRPAAVEIGAMLETPSLAFAPRQFFEQADFISIGGNDLKQFFFAADRENDLVRRRYDTLSVSFLTFIEMIVGRCRDTGTHLSFCGEDAGRPVEALCFVAMGLRALSMRPASIGPVKQLLRRIDLGEVRAVIDEARASGAPSVRPALMKYLEEEKIEVGKQAGAVARVDP